MNQPQNSPAAEKPKIKVRIDIETEFGADTATLASLVEKVKPLVASAKSLGEPKAVAIFGKQKIAIV